MPAPEVEPGAPAPRHLLHVFSTFATGGPQRRFADLANRFGRRFRHTLIALDGNEECARLLDPGLDLAFHRLNPPAQGSLLRRLGRHRREIAAIAPDLLLTYNWGAIEWALANRVRPLTRHIHFEDGFRPDEARGQKRRRVLLRRFALKKTRHVIVPSRTLYQVARQIWHLPAAQLLYVPNGIEAGRYGAAPPPLDPPLPGKGKIIGTIATLRAEKNLARLIRATAALPEKNVRLVIAGEGPERPALEHLAAETGIGQRTFFLGQVQPELVLGHFDLFALSSDTEQMPLSILEAMAAGLPVASVRVGDVAAMLAPANAALLAAPGDTKGLGALMAKLLADDALRARLGAENRAHVTAHFSALAMIAAYERIFSTAA